MRLASCRYQGETRLALIVGGNALVLERHAQYPDMLTLIQGGAAALAELREYLATHHPDLPLDRLPLLAPIPRPLKNILCLGWNYREHAHESAKATQRTPQIPQHPVVFTKAVTAVTGPYARIPYDAALSTQIDWEVELGVIIGRDGYRISREHALDHVFGYTIINDLSARDIQARHKQFFLGKSLDGHCPMGPWIVTHDEIPDPQRLALTCTVNGVLKQQANTRDQLFDVATTISILSHGMTLEAGDIIATGTPAGVGFARTPPEFLRPGDTVVCEIEGIGRLENTIA